jgi:quinone-modifying oxidoreductase subunit QmoC
MCTIRCPRGIQPTQLMHAVEAIAERNGYKPKTSTLILFRRLRDAMKRGRIWEFGMAMQFYFSSNIFKGLPRLPLALSLVTRGLMPISPPRKVKGSAEVVKIMDKVNEMQKTGGAS